MDGNTPYFINFRRCQTAVALDVNVIGDIRDDNQLAYVLFDMFSTQGLFQSLACPRKSDCTNPTFCPFSHTPDPALRTPLIVTPAPTPAPTVPAKRPFELTASTSRSEPPPQRIRTASAPKPVALASSSVRLSPARPSTSHPLIPPVRCPRPQSQCRTVAGGRPCPPGSRSPLLPDPP